MDTPEAAEKLGRAVSARRSWLGMKRKDLAEASGLSYPYIAEIENGKKAPSARALRSLAAALEMSPVELMSTAEDVPETPEVQMSMPIERQIRRDSNDFKRSSTFGLATGPLNSSTSWSPEPRRTAPDDTVSELLEELRYLRRRLDRMDDELRDMRAELRGRVRD